MDLYDREQQGFLEGEPRLPDPQPLLSAPNPQRVPSDAQIAAIHGTSHMIGYGRRSTNEDHPS